MTVARMAARALGAATVGYFGLTSATLAVGTERTVRRLRTAPRGATVGAAAFTVVLPMLREQSIVEATLRRYLPLVDRHDAEVVVATTGRETADASAGTESTFEIATRVCGELNAGLGRAAFRVVDAPADAMGKVGQMNAALATVDQRGDRPHYVAVYDADSAPDLGAFDIVIATVAERVAAAEPAPPIFQQVSCFTRNLPAASGWRGLLQIADALAQTRWALGFEYAVYERYASAVRAGRLRPLVYCIGHGCFVDRSFLARIGGFPTISPNDDLALGYLASALGVEVAPVPALDFCDVAPDPVATVRQSRFWFRGSARFHRDLADFATRWPPPPPLQRAVLLAHGHGRNAAWAGRAVLWCTALVLALATRSRRLAWALVVAHVVYVQGGFAHALSALRRVPGAAASANFPAVSDRRIAAAAVAATPTFVLRSLGPLTAVLGAGRRTAPFKVER